MVSPDPSGRGAALVTAGPTAPNHADLAPPVMLYVDRTLIDGGGHLHIHGWAVSATPVVTVQVFAGEVRVGNAELGHQRDDVARTHTRYPNAATSGFLLAKRLGTRGEIATLRVQAVCMNGFSHELVVSPEHVTHISQARAAPKREPTAEQVRPAVRAIRMHCDEVALREDGTLAASGWAVCATAIAAVEVLLDGELVGEAELGGHRPDVAAEYPAVAMSRFSGFRFHERVRDGAQGEHKVVLIARNGLGDTHAESCIVQTTQAALVASALEPKPSSVDWPEFHLEVDKPSVKGGAVADPVVGRLTIEGWALASERVVAVNVFIDDEPVGEAHYGLARRDVAEAFPDHESALRVGYVFHCPLRRLHNGAHTVRVDARAADGSVASRRFQIDVKKAEEANGYAQIRRSLLPAQADFYADLLERLDFHPAFTLLLRQSGSLDSAKLEATLRSLALQVYPDWRLLIVADAPESAATIHALVAGQWPELAERIELLEDIDTATFDASLYAVLCPGDELGCDALAEIATAGGLHRGADLLYADESRVSPVSGEREPYFKPDFSPDLLLSTNYIGRPWFATGNLLNKTSVTGRTLLGRGEYDLVLRCAELAAEIRHVPKLLCHRGEAALDFVVQEKAALAAAAARRRDEAEVLAGCVPGTWRLRRTARASGMVSIIIPTCGAHGHVKTCIETIRTRTAYRNFEIIVIDNIPASEPYWKAWLAENADKLIAISEAFNWSRFNNKAAEHAVGEYLLFLNDDVEIIQDDWLDAMLEHAQRPEVGIVGPQLLYPDGKVQHAGMFLSSLGLARHAFRLAPGDDPCYFGLARTQRNVMAVTGACMLVRRQSFHALRGFDEAHQIVNNDLDYCLRTHKAGLLTIYTPHSTLIHHELASRDKLGDVFNAQHFNTKWKALFAAGDPFFNPRLARLVDDFRPDDEPVQEIFAGHPLCRREEIRRILAVKLDHIGDFITAIPAIRRLRALFPAAALHVLASGAARSLAAMESSIDGLIDFEFFNARSGLGQRTLAEGELQALRERLAQHQFDLAVDLRRHLDTREVLRCTGARFLAGYDHAGLFPFLNIALEWEDDVPLHRKRTHVSDALLNLVDAIGTACDPHRVELALPAN